MSPRSGGQTHGTSGAADGRERRASQRERLLELYRHERPHPALPVDEFLDELQALVRAHPIDARLAQILKYGGASRAALQRWIKDYYQWLRLDAQGTAATIARCPRRGLYLALSPVVSRKTGFHQVTPPAVTLFVRFAAAFDVSHDALEAHFACPETSRRRSPACSSSSPASTRASSLRCSPAKGRFLDVTRDERSWFYVSAASPST